VPMTCNNAYKYKALLNITDNRSGI
jgi:hypothetical protein